MADCAHTPVWENVDQLSGFQILSHIGLHRQGDSHAARSHLQSVIIAVEAQPGIWIDISDQVRLQPHRPVIG